jgi:hypothetical protein
MRTRLYGLRATRCWAAAAALCMTGCRQDTNGHPVRMAGAHSCHHESESRWAPASPQYRLTAQYRPPESLFIEEVGGIVTDSQSVYVLDSAQPRIFVLTLELEHRLAFGSQGSGPGELSRERDRGRRGKNWRWIDVSADTVAVFDGQRVQLFTTEGLFVSVLTQAGTTLSPETPRIVFTNDRLWYAAGGYDALFPSSSDRQYDWYLIRRSGRSDARIASMRLNPLPISSRGIPFHGPEQASPLWDYNGGCVVMSDGSSPWLIRVDTASARPDTIELTLPRIAPGTADRQEVERILGQAGGSSKGYRAPSLVRKIVGLTVDPDGWVWLLPVQERTQGNKVRVLWVAPDTKDVREVWLPAFPAAFGEAGSYYAVVKDDDTGEPEIVLYDLHSNK